MLTTSYELVKHSYSPHFVDEGSGAQRGPWGCCLKAQILLRTCGRAGVRDTKPPHGSQLSRHEQGVSLSRLAVCSTGDHRGDTCWVWAGGSWLCPVLSPHPRRVPGKPTTHLCHSRHHPARAARVPYTLRPSELAPASAPRPHPPPQPRGDLRRRPAPPDTHPPLPLRPCARRPLTFQPAELLLSPLSLK